MPSAKASGNFTLTAKPLSWRRTDRNTVPSGGRARHFIETLTLKKL